MGSNFIFGKKLLRAYVVLFYYVPNQNKVFLSYLMVYRSVECILLVTLLFISIFHLDHHACGNIVKVGVSPQPINTLITLLLFPHVAKSMVM
jgi:hypothetical protein